MAVAQFRGDLTDDGLSKSLVDLIQVVCGPSRYFTLLDASPAALAEGLRLAADAADNGA